MRGKSKKDEEEDVMNAQYLMKSIAALTMISVIAVGCSGGGQSADGGTQFQSPRGRTVNDLPLTNQNVSADNDASDPQKILDAIMGATAAANDAKAAADAAKAAADAGKASSDAAKASAEEANNNAKVAAKKAGDAEDKANLAAWIAGIGSALAIAASITGDVINHKNDKKNRDKILEDIEMKHEEALSAHAGTQAMLTAQGRVVGDIRRDQLDEINQGNTNSRAISSMKALVSRLASQQQDDGRIIRELDGRVQELASTLENLGNANEQASQELLKLKDLIANFGNGIGGGTQEPDSSGSDIANASQTRPETSSNGAGTSDDENRNQRTSLFPAITQWDFLRTFPAL